MTFDIDSYRPMPVSYELRYMMLKKIKAGEDPPLRARDSPSVVRTHEAKVPGGPP